MVNVTVCQKMKKEISEGAHNYYIIPHNKKGSQLASFFYLYILSSTSYLTGLKNNLHQRIHQI